MGAGPHADGGICGSDLGIVSLEASPSASPFSSFPSSWGTRTWADAELGRGVRGFTTGERVTVNPLLCCEPRGLTPRARRRRGTPLALHAVHGRGAAPGMLIGTTRGIGGSWGEEFVAHASQLVRVRDTMSDAEAVLTEPFACCVHAARNALPGPASAPGDRRRTMG